MTLLLIGAAAVAALAASLLFPRTASAHCDTMDGPAVRDGKQALETGNVNHALKWVHPDGEEELRRAFDLSTKVRALGADARQLADQYFLETLVRVHRAGEGAPFEGIQPSGTPIDPRVAAADESIEVATLAPLAGLVPAGQVPELERRFRQVLLLKDYDVDDLDGARAYIGAYVDFFKFAEGEEHHHGDGAHHEGHEAHHH